MPAAFVSHETKKRCWVATGGWAHILKSSFLQSKREMTTDIPSVLQISVHPFSQFTEYRFCHCGRVMIYGVDVGEGEVDGLRG